MTLIFESRPMTRSDITNPLDRLKDERRRHRRVAVDVAGRFMREDRQEHGCKLIDISVGGAAVRTSEKLEFGERLVCYFDDLGRLEGTVSRIFFEGFALQFQMTPHKREKLAAQLTWFANRRMLGMPDARRHFRVIPETKDGSVELPNGEELDCEILDVSISGASIGSKSRPVIGTEIKVGRLRGRVVRHHDQGFGIQFIDIQNPTALRKHFS